MLGNDQTGIAAAARLTTMLAWHARSAGLREDRVRTLPVNAEDFLLLYRRPTE